MCLKWCVLSPASPCFCGVWWTRPHLASVGSGGQPFYIFNQLKRVSRFYFTTLTSLFVTVWASEFEMRLLKLCFICGAARDRHFMQTCMTAYVNMNVHYIAQLFYIQFVSPCTCDLWMSITFSLKVTSTPTAWDTSYFAEGKVFAFPDVIVLHQEEHFPSSNFNFLYKRLRCDFEDTALPVSYVCLSHVPWLWSWTTLCFWHTPVPCVSHGTCLLPPVKITLSFLHVSLLCLKLSHVCYSWGFHDIFYREHSFSKGTLELICISFP